LGQALEAILSSPLAGEVARRAGGDVHPSNNIGKVRA
jgi:hypothetical protein